MFLARAHSVTVVEEKCAALNETVQVQQTPFKYETNKVVYKNYALIN